MTSTGIVAGLTPKYRPVPFWNVALPQNPIPDKGLAAEYRKASEA